MDTRSAVSVFTVTISLESLISYSALQLHHRDLSDKPPESRFPDMPCLEKLRIMVIGGQNALFHTYPLDVAYSISTYCTSSFASVNSLHLDFLWCLSLPRPPGVPLLQPQAFLFLDDFIHNPGRFPELKSVVLNFSPMLIASDSQETLQALQDEVQLEAKTVFCKVAQRVEEFSVVSDLQAFR
jgi:hypothetical protein